jgi:hypothetical protein
VRTYYEEEAQKDMYSFYMTSQDGYVPTMDFLETVDDVMGLLQSYFDTLENRAGISLTKKIYVDDKDSKYMIDEDGRHDY